MMVERLNPLSVDTPAYSLAGLCIVSNLPLPALAPWTPENSRGDRVLIRRSRVPGSLSSVDVVFPDGQCNEKELLLTIPEIATYLIRTGTEILVDQAPASNFGDVRGYLLGTVFGVLCHQRGITPLHASAIDVADGCVAFVGDSGTGKSTLVAALAARGHQVIADDVCFLQPNEQGQVRVWPGMNRLRLWEDAMKALGYDGPGVEREFRGYNKYLIPLHAPPNPSKPRQLRRVYQLEPAPEGERASVHRLRGAAVVEVLIQNIYRLGLAEHMGRKANAFVVCAAAAQDIPIFRFSRPLGFHALGEAVNSLENHLRDVP